MKINYEVSTVLNKDQLFALIKESIEKKTDKRLENILWYKSDSDLSCRLTFCDESVEIE